MSKPRIAFVAPSIGNAMGPLTAVMCKALGDQFDVRLFAPEHFPYVDADLALSPLPTAKNKYFRGIKMLDPRTHSQLCRDVERFQPDLVHIFNSEGYPWSVTLARWCRRHGVPLVVTLHDPRAHPGDAIAWLNERLGALTLTKATVVQLFHQRFIDEVKQRYGRPVFMTDFVSISDFYLMHRTPNVARENLVLQFGRLEYYKGIDTLVDAAEFLPPQLKICIAGPGTLSRSVKKKISANLERFETHERFLADEEVARLFQRARVLALPYREVTQSLLHGIAAEFGVPVVASDIGFFRDEVPRLGGLLVPPGDPKALADAIVRAIDMKPTIPSSFGTESAIRQYSQMYRLALKAGGDFDSISGHAEIAD